MKSEICGGNQGEWDNNVNELMIAIVRHSCNKGDVIPSNQLVTIILLMPRPD